MLPVRYLPATGLLLAGSLLTGCGKKEAPAAAMMMGGTPEVSVLTVKAEPVKLSTELAGRVAASLTAEVRPQVGGIIRERHFTEGSDVQAGDLLYQIDPATYQASFEASKAALAKAEANLVPVQLKAERYSQLRDDDAVSQQDLDDIVASQKLAEAEIASAKANLEAARINLEYTQVTAPISGRIGRSFVTTGALVTAGQATPLAMIQSLDPVYVDITQSSAEMLKLRRALEDGEIRRADREATVTLILDDGSAYPESGTLKFTEAFVDETTGSVTLRSSFPNPKLQLLPGMFVRAILEEGVKPDGMLVPQRAVTRNPAGKPLAMVVGAEDKVEPRILTTERSVGDSWLVSGGLQPGDRVIMEGLQKARPGTPVTAVPFDPNGATATAAAGH
ncbi:MAG: efflux RND transporter periplasmic adaptor subunit [Akkermansiaceae bacterium]|nr:efflux RND transporter periplasmic adaptor subunit [Akkermansiaceae bacterium]MCP5544565.1 efflux RND transporter periplasmic adaptor subunit [Akkermansiaceae bacterium]MCP5547967.1 efflux RND transporter periplasmic adaptor subunit [Akkermansiaceae bacterium]